MASGAGSSGRKGWGLCLLLASCGSGQGCGSCQPVPAPQINPVSAGTCPNPAEAQPVQASSLGGGPVLVVFNPFSNDPSQYNFSLDSAGLVWNSAPDVPLEQTFGGPIVPQPLQIPACHPETVEQSGCVAITPGWQGDSFTFDNPLYGETVVGLMGTTTDAGLYQFQAGAATAFFSSFLLAPDAGYALYPELLDDPFVPISPPDGEDGPKAAYDEQGEAALVTGSINAADVNGGTANVFETLLRIYGGPSFPCAGSPGNFRELTGFCSPSLVCGCPEEDCVDVSPGVLSSGVPTLLAGTVPGQVSILGTTVAIDTTCYAGLGSRHDSPWATHAPVVGFNQRAFVAFMLDDSSDVAHPVPALAVVDYSNPASPQIAWRALPFRAPLLPCPTGLDGGQNDPSHCLPDCTGTAPIRLGQIPSLAYGWDDAHQQHLLYLAWNQSNEGSPPVEQIVFVALDVDNAWPPNFTVRSAFPPINARHNEYMPSVAAVPTTGEAALFYYSDQGSCDGGGDCPTDACNVQVMACITKDGAAPLSPSDGGAAVSDLGCFPISGTFPMEPWDQRGGYRTDYLGAAPLANHSLLATWVQPNNATISSCASAFAAPVDPPSLAGGCEGLEESGETLCRQLGAACRADAGVGAGCDGGDDCKEGDDQGQGGDQGDEGGGESGDQGGQDQGDQQGQDQDDDCQGDEQGQTCRADGGAALCAALEQSCLRQVEQAEAQCEAQGASRAQALQSLRLPPALPLLGVARVAPFAPLGSPPASGAIGASCSTGLDCDADAGYGCVAGYCGCPPVTRLCSGARGPICANLSTDPAHCGLCGRSCAAGQGCDGGVCGP